MGNVIARIEKDPASAPKANPSQVEEKLKILAGTAKFKVDTWKNDLNSAEWLSQVDAANLIAQTCIEISESRVSFDKKGDTLYLLKGVQKKSPKKIDELANYVAQLV